MEEQSWFIVEIDAGLQEANEGGFASDEEVLALVRKWQVVAKLPASSVQEHSA